MFHKQIAHIQVPTSFLTCLTKGTKSPTAASKVASKAQHLYLNPALLLKSSPP